MSAMFCHTCWNLLECCTCDAVARGVHPSERVPFDGFAFGRPMDPVPGEVVAEAEQILREAPNQ